MTNRSSTFKKRWPLAATTAALLLGAGAAHAQLVLVAPEDFGGTGLGAVNTVLTITSPGSSTFEAGAVGISPGGAQFMTGDTQAQTMARTLGELGVTSASSLRVVFNAAEPAGGSISLDDLVLNIYSATGSVLFTSSAFSPVSFASTNTGTGNSGFVFGLTGSDLASAQALAFGTGFEGNYVGLSAAASDATGGLETFFVANSATTVTPVPEPGTYAMLLAGLGVMGFVARRSRKTEA
ncbi:MAG TPA: PEP-CTERM sorting domain-containing protein [Burkholderiaceae bacterium]